MAGDDTLPVTLKTGDGKIYGMPKTVLDIDDLYPSSDGEPMTDKDINRLVMEYVELTLAHRYAHDPNIYVLANLFIYYEEGNPKKCIAPDVFLVRGVEKKIRERYLLWEEGGHVPDVAFEFMARRRKQRDPLQKKAIYEQLGVRSISSSIRMEQRFVLASGRFDWWMARIKSSIRRTACTAKYSVSRSTWMAI